MPRITVLIPAYNEEQTILDVLQRVNAQSDERVDLEILVVDDGSTDETVALLERNPHLYTRLLQLPRNGGKGAAVKAGLREATGEFVLFQDADLEYDPADYSKLFRPVLDHHADLVMGSRLTAPEFTRVHYFWHKLGNRFITQLFNVVNNTTFSDIYSCYLLFRRSLVDPERLKSTGWEQQAEILSWAARSTPVMYEVPISYHGRTYAEGKKIRGRHVIAIVLMILRGRMFSTPKPKPEHAG